MEREFIVFVATAWSAKFGGINVFNKDLVEALAHLTGRTFEVVCVVLNAENNVVKEAKKKRGVLLISLDHPKPENIFEKTFAGDAWIRIQEAFEGPKVKWWVGHDAISGAAANRLREVSKQGKSAVIKHMSYVDYTSYKHGSARIAQEKYNDQRNIFSSADKRFAVGPLLRDRLAEMVGADVTMLIPGLQVELSAKPPKVFSAITFGRLDPGNDRIKQGKLAVAAFASAVGLATKEKSRPECLRKGPRMFLFGLDGSDEKEETSLLELAKKEAGEVINIQALPYMDKRAELFEKVSRSSIALMLSWHEGFGLTGWEAISAEVPLIVSDQSGLYQFIDEEIGGAGIGCLHPVHVQGDLGGEEEPHYTAETLSNVRTVVLELANSLVRSQRDAKTLKRLLVEHGCTWDNTASRFADALGLTYKTETAPSLPGNGTDLPDSDEGRKQIIPDQAEKLRQAEACIRSLELEISEVKYDDRTGSYTELDPGQISRLIRTAVCFNQGEVTQYAFLASILHKKLKEAFKQTPGDLALLRDLYIKLETFLIRNLGRIAKKNFQFVKQFYANRHAIDPRVCLKVSRLSEGQESIVDLFRDEPVNYMSEYSLGSNSGFVFVKETGTYFESANIPRDVAIGKYKNARLDLDLAKAYWAKRADDGTERYQMLASDLIEEHTPDWDWINCWHVPRNGNGRQLETDPTSCYKSTLIIPLTFWNVDLDPKFRELLKTKDIGRTIFGFLCLDHVEESYFKEIDVDIGYIFADLLSLYLVTRAIYSEFSWVFNDVQTKINGLTN